MTADTLLQEIEKYIPVVGDINIKSPLAYQVTRGAVEVVNTVQMAVAEAYINGLEVPDSVLESLFDTCMPILFQYFPSLLAPYEWVLKETDHLAEGSRELMKIQYDLPQAMLNTMLWDGKLIYPKYSMGLWEKGALNLEQSQMQMIDDVIEKLDIQDGDNILDFGCGWGCVPNYILSKFPNVRFTGINLSHEQCEYIRHKMQDPESYLSSDRFTLYEGDLNNANFETKFDKILSIGVFCHVGNLTAAFKKLASFLKDDGKVFIHIITVRIPNNMSSVYTHKYIFPHGRYWNYNAVPSHQQDLKTVKQWYINGFNYSKTLTNWLRNFDDNQATIKTLNYGMDYAKFRRIWRFYLIWFIRNFASCDGEYNGNGQFLMVHS
ncbi:SAM-dependent methyltransferase [Nostoc sp. 'Peltigera membranacea cyanobiont' N6]|uniref:SAM-dependent methyltransferase n=1 Tax=Nostoc sp. 'Peltigera membranacea cyanobiont' N6 TaxID=1261031 RepID=UPI000CF34DD0|nr:class I SAM-dependent methyltransferase [Nostoc sp. 'Peltigera membranacea cyanobiont' N6]AVH64345.1 cyclopropane-fatty-acyl-phospholipid synthase [Nostoc sp. 'Peltigera membranacea cyanobiont' N6]